MTAENKGLTGAGAGASNLDNFPPDGKKKLEEWEEVVVMRVPEAPREFQKCGQSPGKPPWSPSAGQGKGGLEKAEGRVSGKTLRPPLTQTVHQLLTTRRTETPANPLSPYPKAR